MNVKHNPAMGYRPEIDGLRAVAILPVIFFHAGVELFSGGFVGVDIFFVISGFLITSILRRELEQGNFSLTRFYERRARRILPALTFVVFSCIPLAWVLMLPEEIASLGDTIGSLATFSSNIYFAGQINYFTPTAESNPLLHTWSLAVEEQYYLLFPLLLMFSWKFGTRGLWMLAFLFAVASLALCEVQGPARPVPTFYLLTTRAWELLAGSLLALWGTRSKVEHQIPMRVKASIPVLGLAMIAVSILYYDAETRFPSVWTLVPVVGAVLVIRFSSGTCVTSRLLGSKPFVGMGLISYSAYLWHQPPPRFCANGKHRRP